MTHGREHLIEWAHHTLNPWQGCTKVSPGCKHCYAEATDKRLLREPVRHWGPMAPRAFASDRYMGPAAGLEPQSQKDRAALACVLHVHGRPVRTPRVTGHAERQDAYRARLFNVIEKTPELDWLLLSKRPENIASMLPAPG